jgi:putative SOS response-associated peptidase YedK
MSMYQASVPAGISGASVGCCVATFNARVETVTEKPMFRRPFKYTRRS